jgi:hypothetical protein
MNAAEIAAKLAAYRDALEIVRHHATYCVEASNLDMDVSETLKQRVAALEAAAAEAEKQPGAKAGKRRLHADAQSVVGDD